MIPATLHIGLEKTGTTSIQFLLNRNRSRLLEQGILFPTSPGEFSQKGLTCYGLNEDRLCSAPRVDWQITRSEDVAPFREHLRKTLRTELEKYPQHRVVLSDEHLSSHLVDMDEIARIRELTDYAGLDIRVLVYLRRQDEFLLSSYSTFVRNGRTKHLNIPKGDECQQRYDYYGLITKWAHVFGAGNIIVRIFQREQLTGGDAVHDFLEVIGLEPDRLEFPHRLNESIDARSLEFARLFNRHVPRLKADGRANPLRGNFYDAIGTVATGARQGLAGLTEFYESFRASNRRVAAEYCGGRSELFVDSPRTGIEYTDDVQLSVEDSVRIAAELWKHKQRQINELRRRIHELESRLSQLSGIP